RAEEGAQRSQSEYPRLDAEEEREAEDLQSAPLHGSRRPGNVTGSPQLRSGRERNCCAGEKEEQRRTEPAEHDGTTERQRGAIDTARPAVDHVCLDHDEHGQAAHPVEVRAARACDTARLAELRPVVRCWRCLTRVGHERRYLAPLRSSQLRILFTVEATHRVRRAAGAPGGAEWGEEARPSASS